MAKVKQSAAAAENHEMKEAPLLASGETTNDEQDKSPVLVKMARDASVFEPPHEADVHPDEVANYQAHGWEIAE